MSERLIRSESLLRNKIRVTVYLPVPGIYDKSEAPAMGDSSMERDENIMKFAEEMWFPQYFRAVKQIVDVYEKSQMPLRYIVGQEIDIFPMLDSVGIYSLSSGKIAIDNDSLLDIRKEGSGAQIFGHEIGHKILFVKDSNELLRNIESLLSIRRKWSHEIIAELAGEVISNETSTIFRFDERAKNYFKRQLLKLAWQ